MGSLRGTALLWQRVDVVAMPAVAQVSGSRLPELAGPAKRRKRKTDSRIYIENNHGIHARFKLEIHRSQNQR